MSLLHARRTKILATLGPATSSPDMLARMLTAGVDGVRLNFSHGSHKEHEDVYRRVREAATRAGRPLAVVQDIQGPKIRVGDLPPEGVQLAEGARVVLRVSEHADEPGVIPVSYQHLAEDVRAGDPIFMDDGYIQTRVEEVVDRRSVRVLVTAGGILKRHKGLNFPGVRLSVKFPTEKDKSDLRFGQDLGVDYVAASFVRSAADVARVRAELDDRVGTRVISKIELREAVENLEEIVRTSDGVMVARGDLGVELPPEEVPPLQKRIIHMCDRLGVPVITATQMLESMTSNRRPTRAEATDVYNAVLDGTSGVMLSGETAVGKFPIETVATMARISTRAEEHLLEGEYSQMRRTAITGRSPADAVAHSAVRAAEDLDAKAIVTLTSTGSTARHVSKYKPRPPIIAVTQVERTFQQLALAWGVTPLRSRAVESEAELLVEAERVLVESGLVSRGDVVVVTSGKTGLSGTTSTLRVANVGRFTAV